MKFINIKTGSIVEPGTKRVEEQMKKSAIYREYTKEKKVEQVNPENKKEVKSKTKDEIIKELEELGVEVDKSSNKKALEALLNEEKEKIAEQEKLEKENEGGESDA